MARKKKLDKLSLDMIQCAKDGFGCHYGRWKATQPVVEIDSKPEKLPEGWKLCPNCGITFKAITTKRFCSEYCRKQAYYHKNQERINENGRIRYRKRKERMAAANG